MLLGTAAVGLAAAVATPASAAETERKVTVSGHVNKVLSITDDGDNEYVDFADNRNSGTRFRIIGTSTGGGLTVGARIEFGLNSNAAQDATNNTSTNPSTLDHRNAYVWFQSKKWGRVILGKASTATDGAAEIDLSGTSASGYNGAWPMSNYDFNVTGTRSGTANGSTNSGVSVGGVFNSYDGGSRQDLIRYTSPKFKGFTLDASTWQGGAADVALKYGGKFFNTKISAAAGLVSNDSISNGDTYVATVSALHGSGINATVSYANSEIETAYRSNAQNFFAKLGYRVKVFGAGETRMSVSYQRTDDRANNDDVGKTWGLQVVQILDGYGTELIAGYSNFELERTSATLYDDIDAGWIGARVRF